MKFEDILGGLGSDKTHNSAVAHDVDFLFQSFNALVKRKGGSIEWTDASGLPVYHFSCRSRHSVLITAGIHGSEPGPVYGLLRWLNDYKWTDRNIWIAPILNPSGFREGRRWYENGVDPNRGYGKGKHSLAREFADKKWVGRGKNGVLSLHEDGGYPYGYVYGYGDQAAAETLRDEVARFFKLPPDHLAEYLGKTLTQGVIMDEKDGSLENYLFDNGAVRAFTTETPSGEPLDQRAAANAALIEKFLRLPI